MASVFKNTQNEEKASSLDASVSEPSKETGGKKKRMDGKGRLPAKATGTRLAIVADILLLVLIAGIIAGAFFGLRALKSAFTPVGEECRIRYSVALYDVDPESFPYKPDGSYAICDNPVWLSDKVDGDCIGEVTDLKFKLNINDQGNDTLTVYITVEADAVLYDGTADIMAGYYVENTRIAAGLEGGFRMNGLYANGTVVSMTVVGDSVTEEEETEPATEAATDAPDAIDSVKSEENETENENTTAADTSGK